MGIRGAVVQMHSEADKAANIEQAIALVRRAAEEGARLIVLPELWTYLGPERGQREHAQPVPGQLTRRLGELARELHVLLHAGSFLEIEETREGDRIYNTAVFFDADGNMVARYRKMHLFDTDPVPGARPYQESATITSGSELVTLEREGLPLGLATCYDLRFPEMLRMLALRGAEILLVPAAFTLETGRDHWEVLVRARAIENGCYVLAAGQWGTRADGRTTYGHSMIVDPWGTVLAQAADGVGVASAEIDPNRVADARRRLPVLANRRPECYDGVTAASATTTAKRTPAN
jgi:predicted amidohydrolase